MAELNLKQITDKLNMEFKCDSRKLVFWYDTNAEFEEDVDTLELENAKVLHLEQDNQFYIKYFLECVDTSTNYLVYAPFAKPPISENHLEDTILYSKEFFADRASLIMIDLGIKERYKPIIQKYISFFAEKERTQKFYDMEIEVYDPNTIETAMLSVLCKCKIPSFEEIVRTILTEEGFEDNQYLEKFKKFDLLPAFWQKADEIFGYADANPTLEKFTITMFVTYMAHSIYTEVPPAWKGFVSQKSGNIIAFLDNLMNSYIYGKRFDEISAMVYKSINGTAQISKIPIESLVDCTLFAEIDDILMKWMIERLDNEDVGAKLREKSIPQLVKERRQKHFGLYRSDEYMAIENAYYIIANGRYLPITRTDEIIKYYTEQAYQMDMWYRYFYYYYDKIENNTSFDRLRELVENIYTNDYLDKICVDWNKTFDGTSDITNQLDFYNKYVENTKERVVVIISDALRYEVGMSLYEKLSADEKCTAKIDVMQGVMPSFTKLGMAALLPHNKVELCDDGTVTIDGKHSDGLKQREAILSSYAKDSLCIQFDDIKGMKVSELRNMIVGKNVIYIYHNQIDARGDKPTTENEVFNACEEAIDEICTLIRRLTSANVIHFIVTADHGFLYKRDKMRESDKIPAANSKGVLLSKRYYVADNEIDREGIDSIPLSTILRSDDTRVVSFPIGSDIFKMPGSGVNYVHGGSSPQELLIPVVDVKTEKGHMETTSAQITLISGIAKITNLITSLDFIQTEPISDVVKETTYRIYFIDKNGEKISNEHIYVADSSEPDTVNRIFKLRFTFKNMKYDNLKPYYLVAYDDKNDLEIIRHGVFMDIAFADDFKFF